MRVPTEYIVVFFSIGALSLITFTVLSTPTPEANIIAVKTEKIVGGFYTPASEDSFSTKSFSELLSSFEWRISKPTKVENNQLATVVNYSSEPEDVIEEPSIPPAIAETKEEIEEAPIVEPITESTTPPPTPMTLKLKTFTYYNSSLVERDSISFSASVQNIGDTFSATSTFVFSFDKDSDGTIDTVLSKRELAPLIPNETRSESWKNALLPPPGNHTATVCLVSKEVSHGENCISFEFTVVPQKSDLIVQPISITPTNPVAGSWVTVSSPIKNQGKGKALMSLTRLRIDAQNNGTWDIVSSFSTTELESGEIFMKEWTSIWRSVAGLVKIEVCTDIENMLTEADEENNCRIDVFTVTPGNYIGASSAKFTIENGELSPLSHSIIPGGTIILSNRDSESYSISGNGGMGSIFLSPDTEGSMQAPPYEGTYTFSPLYGASFTGTVVVE